MLGKLQIAITLSSTLIRFLRPDPTYLPNDGPSIKQLPVSPGRRLVGNKISRGLWSFLVCLNPKTHRLSPKLSDFS